MKHVLIIYGKPKGHGKARRNVPEYIGPVPPRAVSNVARWFVELYLDKGPTPEEIKS